MALLLAQEKSHEIKRIQRRYYQTHRKKKITASHAGMGPIVSAAFAKIGFPEKIKLHRHNREVLEKRATPPHESLTPAALADLVKKQEGICALCFQPMADGYSIDHIIPLSRGGPHAIYNIQLAHHRCNSMKQNKLTEGHSECNHRMGAFKRDDGHFYRFGAPGSPDIICVVDGRYVGIEVKALKGRQSDHQKEFQKNLEAAGKYILAFDLDDVIKEESHSRIQKSPAFAAGLFNALGALLIIELKVALHLHNRQI
jgi:5-methylcytosine-specific restriction endonuclease McrA